MPPSASSIGWVSSQLLSARNARAGGRPYQSAGLLLQSRLQASSKSEGCGASGGSEGYDAGAGNQGPDGAVLATEDAGAGAGVACTEVAPSAGCSVLPVSSSRANRMSS